MSRALVPELGFRRLLLLTLAAAGCSAKTPAKSTPVVDPEPVAVAPVESPAPVQPTSEDCGGPMFSDDALRPARAAEGIVLHERRDLPVGSQPAGIVAQSGALCASGDEACETSIEALWQTEALRKDCGQVGCTHAHLAYATSEGVTTVATAADLAEFLGTIDTAAEARLLAWAARFDVPCAPTPEGDGWSVVATQHVSDCPMQTDQVSLTVSADGTLTETERVVGPPGPCAGRLPPGLCNAPDHDRSVGEWLANAAHMEAASVHAFEILVEELRAHDAPALLVQAARDAASDERRHARIMGALARARGATVLRAEVVPVATRSLAEIAMDNAAEGLGRETWGALLALSQAQHATDPEIRQAMASIAWDEVGHAEFSRALHAWLAPRLSDREREDVDAARAQAWATLSTEVGRSWAPGVAELLGMPQDPARLIEASRVAGLAA